MTRLTFHLFLFFLLGVSFLPAQNPPPREPSVVANYTNVAPQRPTVFARSALAIDARTGAILYEKNSTFRQPAASTQKLLTALVVIRDGNLLAPITITKSDTLCEPTKVYVRAGERYTRMALLEALLVKSGNDAARALARDNAGSQEAFAAKMNRLARQLGAYDSNFVNPNGLPDPNQYSCARDIAIIARAAYRNPVIRRITAMKTLNFSRPGRGVVTYRNTNKLLTSFPYTNGLKTGYTNLSGHCLVSSGSSTRREAIVVVLKSNKANVWNDSRQLLAWSLGVPSLSPAPRPD